MSFDRYTEYGIPKSKGLSPDIPKDKIFEDEFRKIGLDTGLLNDYKDFKSLNLNPEILAQAFKIENPYKHLKSLKDDDYSKSDLLRHMFYIKRV